MMFKNAFLFVGLLSSTISAFAINNVLAVVTPTPHLHELIAGPKPTEAPWYELKRRQQASQGQGLLAAPDNTCGYFGGSSASPWGCSKGNCVFATATAAANSTSTVGSILCCDPTSGCPVAPAPTGCVDKGLYDYNTTCTGTCPDDPMILKCTKGIDIFCNLIAFPTPAAVTQYFCNYISTYLPRFAETTFSGQEDHAFTPTVASFQTTTSTSLSSSPVSSSFKTSATGSKTAKATPTSTAAGTEKKSVNKGVIIGGVIGGVVGLALIIGAVFFFLRWRYSDDEVAEEKQNVIQEAVVPVANK